MILMKLLRGVVVLLCAASGAHQLHLLYPLLLLKMLLLLKRLLLKRLLWLLMMWLLLLWLLMWLWLRRSACEKG
jgi:hypothetical protein